MYLHRGRPLVERWTAVVPDNACAHAGELAPEVVLVGQSRPPEGDAEYCGAELRFDLNLVVAGDDGEHVAIVYESPIRLKDGTETTIGSMEIFRVIDGRITEVWNCGYQQGVWS